LSRSPSSRAFSPYDLVEAVWELGQSIKLVVGQRRQEETDEVGVKVAAGDQPSREPGFNAAKCVVCPTAV